MGAGAGFHWPMKDFFFRDSVADDGLVSWLQCGDWAGGVGRARKAEPGCFAVALLIWGRARPHTPAAEFASAGASGVVCAFVAVMGPDVSHPGPQRPQHGDVLTSNKMRVGH